MAYLFGLETMDIDSPLDLTNFSICSKFKAFAKYKAQYSPKECPARVILFEFLIRLSLQISINIEDRIFNEGVYFFDHPYFGMIVSINEI